MINTGFLGNPNKINKLADVKNKLTIYKLYDYKRKNCIPYLRGI